MLNGSISGRGVAGGVTAELVLLSGPFFRGAERSDYYRLSSRHPRCVSVGDGVTCGSSNALGRGSVSLHFKRPDRCQCSGRYSVL
jgi:hypothetical protein